ncbi:MAG: sulfurtransferase [Candidatus Tectomicrobia bacterium]|uniref:Sulfurtransferase n=1 Tax=Tectimicrobiota bacterium TaxID=2528274 RepID=A0A932M072_UNCTE|nr:sulfurtransferase [Candidatus Tectomicrobia bacterium]
MADYAHPEVLVSTQWVQDRMQDPDVRIVEVDVDTKAYDEGHIPDAVGWAWDRQLCDTFLRDIIPRDKFENLMGSSGIDNNTTVILYGDNNNWFAAWALWQMKIYGHQDVRLMNGGRKKWIEEGRELAKEPPHVSTQTYRAKDPDLSIRSFLPDVHKGMEGMSIELVDVRSPQEFTGEILSPPGLPETCQRGGHIPGARNITWSRACNDDGSFKSREELQQLYESAGITGNKPVVAYCGERSSHTWFVLKYLLGFNDVKNYDGSWTEWGNLVRAPIERPA